MSAFTTASARRRVCQLMGATTSMASLAHPERWGWCLRTSLDGTVIVGPRAGREQVFSRSRGCGMSHKGQQDSSATGMTVMMAAKTDRRAYKISPIHRESLCGFPPSSYRLGSAAWPTRLRASSPYDHAPACVPAVSATHEGVVEEGKRCGNRICPFWISALAPSQNETLHFKMREGIEQEARGTHPPTTCRTRRCRRPPTEHGCRRHGAGTCLAPPPCCQVF